MENLAANRPEDRADERADDDAEDAESFTPPLSFVSWNLAMLERSAQAPPDWGQEHTQAAFRDVILDISPDVVLLQELPGIVPYVETHDMVKANPLSHSGNLATLVGHHLMDEELQVSVVSGAALLTTFVGRDLTVANVHLAPGSGGTEDRLDQIRAVLDAAPTTDVLIAGDTNTRTAEENALAALGLTGDRPPEPTWNGRKNRFRGGAGDFIAYFSRCFTTSGLVVTDLEVYSDRSVEVDGYRFDLSDHYGFGGTVLGRS